MKTAINHNTLKKSCIVFIIMLGCFVNAQVLDPFTPRFNETLKGDYTMIANNMLSRTATQSYNGSSGNHNFNDNVYVDIDGLFDANNDNIDDTFNSSSANYSNPRPSLECLTTYKAYLYWAAADREPTTDPNSENQPNWNYNDIMLMLPGQTQYTTLTADDVIYRGRDFHLNNDPYICFKDITADVQNIASPFGTYQVANVEAKLGSVTGHGGGNIGTSGGWQIVFVYESPELPSKNVSLFDGYANVTSAINNFDITFNGFQTVPTGNVNANVLIGSLEGDQDLSGDQLQIQNTAGNFVAISAPQRNSNNFFNSRITIDNADFLDRNPASQNTLGFDAAVFNLNNTGNTLIDNNQTSATLRLASNQETYGLYLVGLCVDVWAPDLDPIAIIMDAGSTPTDPGSTLGMSFTILNQGNDNAVNLTISSTLPPQVADVNMVNLPTGITYNFNSSTNVLEFFVQDGFTDVGDPQLEIDFDIILQNECYFLEDNCELEFGLQFTASYNGIQNPNLQTILSSSGVKDCNIGDKSPLTIEVNQPTVEWATNPGDLDTSVDCNDLDALNAAQNLAPETDVCDFTLLKTSGLFIEDINYPGTGTYTNTWSFSDACGVTIEEYVQVITVGEPYNDITISSNQNNVLCNGESTGSINVNVNGGIPPYTYNWTGPNAFISNDEDITDVPAGLYTLVVTDSNLCQVISETIDVTIIEPTLQACEIQVDNCPPDVEIGCADSDAGANIYWMPPTFAYECCTSIDGDDYSFFMEFDLPESSFGTNCWEFNYAQRVGTDNLRLFQSSGTIGTRYEDSFLITPTQFFNNQSGTPINIELIDVTATVNWTLQVLNPADDSVIYSDTINGITTDGQQTITIPNTVPDGAYKLKLNFSSPNATGGDKIEIDRMYYDATLIDANCAGGINFVVTSTHNPGDLFIPGTTTVTYTATYTPVSGDPVVLTCDFDVEVVRVNAIEDINSRVEPTCDNNNDGSFTVVASGGTPPYSYSLDNNDFSNTSGVFFDLPAGTYTVYVKDSSECNDPDPIEITLTVADTETPTIVAPDDYSIEGCGTNAISDLQFSITVRGISLAELQAALGGNGTANDDQNIDTITYFDVAVGSCPIVIERTFTVTDECGNSASDKQFITIEDTTPPTLTLPGDIDVECNESINPSDTGQATATDNCGSTTITYSDSIVADCGNTEIITRTWTAEDSCGHLVSGIQTISIVDNTAPTINVPGSVEIECTESTEPSNTGTATGTDSCGNVIITYSDSAIAACGNTQTITRTWIATDDCGNASSETQTINVVDTVDPEISACSVENTTLECTSDNNETLAIAWNNANIAELEACATDNCDTNFTGQITSDFDFNDLNSTCGPCGTLDVTYTIADDCGNETSLTVTLSFDDGTIPDVSNCSVSDESIECSGDDNEQLANDWNAANISELETCADDLGITVSSNYAYTNLVSTCGQGGIIAVIYTIEDDCGNSTTLNATLTLEDNTPPNLDNCSVTDQSIECSGESNEQLADNWNAANIAALENCGTDSCDTDFSGQVTSSYAFANLDPTCGQGGTIAVIYTITDDCGNDTNLSVTLTLEDTTPPNLDNCSVTDQSIECSGDNNEQLADEWNAANIAALEDCETDACDNSTIEPRDTSIFERSSAAVTSDYSYTNLVSTCGQGGTIDVIYTVTDSCGNESTLTATLTLEDTSDPDLSSCTVENTVLECSDTNNESLADAWDAANIATLETCATDSCDTDFTSQVTSDYDFDNLNTTCGPCGTINVTYTITDDCGNDTTLTVTLTFDDGTIPDLSNCTVTDESIECSGTNNEQLANDWNAANITALENCADDLGVTVTSNYAFANLISTCGQGGTIPVVYTITDDCGNSTTLSATLTLEDTTPPNLDSCSVTDQSIECSGDDNEQLANDWNAANIAALESCGTDTCDTDFSGQVTSNYAFGNLVSTCGQGGTIAVVYTITDDCGNDVTLNATLTLEDTTPPNLDNCSVTDQSIECSGTDNETLANDWNAANIAALESCGTDTCDTDFSGQVTSDYTFGNLVSTCGQGGTIAVVYTITDDCGNDVTLNATLTLEDTTPPNLDNCSVTDQSIECSGDDNEQLANDWNAANIAALESCGTDTCDTDFSGQVTSDYAFDNLVSTCGQGGTIAVVYTITDDCGNDVTLNATLTLEDTTPPNLDNCSVTDQSIECSGDDNEQLANDWNAANIAALESCGTDTCDTDFSGQVTSDYVFGNLVSTCGQGGTIAVVYTITDDCGNDVTLNATLTLEDTTPPNLDNCSVTDQSIECSGDDNEQLANDWNAANIAALESCGTDTCDTDFSGQVTSDYAFGNLVSTCGQGGTIAVVYTITDDCGNDVTLNATLTLEDTTPPNLDNCSVTDQSIECSGEDNEQLANDWNAANIAALESCGTDSCDTDFSGQVTSDYAFGNLVSTCGQGGTISVIYTISDDCGNDVTLNATLTLEDTSAPDLSACTVENTVLECSDTENETLADAWNAANIAALEACAADTCDTDFSGQVTSNYDFNNLNTTCGPCGTLNVTYTITDDCGNDTTLIATLTFDDGTIPDLSNCSVTDQSIECSGDDNEQLANDWNAVNISALENCADDLGVTVTSNYAFTNLTTTCGQGGTIAVVYTITDDCGNATTLSATLTLEDTTPPNLDNCSVTDQSIECSGEDNEQLANDWNAANIAALESCGTDACDTDFSGQVTSDYSYNSLVSTCGQGGTIAVVYTITDDCGNDVSLNATLTLEDTTPPSLDNCSVTDQSIECSGEDNEQIANDWNAANIASLESCISDACDTDFNGQITSDYAYTNLVTTCGQGGTLSVIYTITDDCGNVATLNATLTLEDTTPPTLDNCSVTDQSIECSGDENEQLANDWNAANIAALENCGVDSCDTDFTGQITSDYAFSNLVTTCGQGGTIAVIYTITDDCGNEVTLNATLTLEDTSIPELSGCTVENTVLECTDTNNESLADAWNAANIAALESCATDACDTDFTGQVTSDYDFDNLNTICGPCGIINVVYTITDDCGNSTTLNASLTFDDGTIPDLSNCVVEDTTIECAGDQNATLASDWNDNNITTLENCADDIAVIVTSDFDYNNLVTTCGLAGTLNVVYTITDDCGNATTLEAMLTIEDTTAPTFTVPESVTLECDQDLTDLTLTGDVIDEADSCSIEVLDATFIDEEPVIGECPNTFTINRVWTLTDDCGNAATFIQTLTVQDTTAPTFTVPESVTLECDQDATDLTLTGDVTDEADNCSTDLEATFEDGEPTTGECPTLFSFIRTWTLVDDCDNTTSLTQTITVQDTTAPTFTVPESVTLECDQDVTDLSLTGDVTDEADNCSVDLEATFEDGEPTVGDCPQQFSFVRTWTLVDDCDNTTTLTQTITVEDTTAPTFTVPENVTIECDQDATDLTLTGDVTDEADNCSTDLEATFVDGEPTTGECPTLFSFIRTWTLVDDCDNTTTLTQTITVQDTTAPTFTVPENVTIECDQDVTDLTLTGDVIDEADNCSADLEATFEDGEPATGECPTLFSFVRTWTLVDDCDNTTTLTQTITVQDTTAPTFTVPENVTIECDQDVTDLSLTGDVTDEADNCSVDLEATFEDGEPATGECPTLFSFVRTWTLIDDCDNTTTLTQTITVQDTTPPTFTVPESVILECDEDVTDLNLTGDVTDEADNCSADLEATFMDSEPTTGECPELFSFVRTWTLTDDCDNTTTLSQTIIVRDTTAPTFTVPVDITLECGQDVTDLTLTGDVTDEADNCSTGLEATYTDGPPTTDPCLYSIERTWRLLDDCSNETIFIQTITVEDTTAPEIMGDMPSDIDVDCSDIPDLPELTFEDCSPIASVVAPDVDNPVIINDPTGTGYTIVNEWIVTDDCGNQSIFVQNVNVTVDDSNQIPTTDGSLCIAEDFDFDLFDLLVGDYDIDGVWTVTSGDATIDGSFFNPSSLLDFNDEYTEDQLGDYEFTYTYEGLCPGMATVTITLDDECVVFPCGEDDVVISKAVTPLVQDGVNDAFEITGVEDCGFVYELQIFNRWGAKIYDNPNYQNNWRGEASSGSIGSANYVPTGTYYYVLNLKNSGLRPFTGPIYVSTK